MQLWNHNNTVQPVLWASLWFLGAAPALQQDGTWCLKRPELLFGLPSTNFHRKRHFCPSHFVPWCQSPILQWWHLWCLGNFIWIYFAYTFNFRNKRKIMRIFTLPPTVEIPSEPNFYDSVKKIRLRQQLEMYSIGKYGFSKTQKIWASCIF